MISRISNFSTLPLEYTLVALLYCYCLMIVFKAFGDDGISLVEFLFSCFSERTIYFLLYISVSVSFLDVNITLLNWVGKVSSCCGRFQASFKSAMSAFWIRSLRSDYLDVSFDLVATGKIKVARLKIETWGEF